MTELLLASGFVNGLTALGEKLTAFFTDFGFAEAVQFVLFYLLIYYVSKLLRDNDATKLMFLYWGAILATGVSAYFVELFDAIFFFYFTLILSLFMFLLFNVEVKKSLWDVHKEKEKTDKVVGGHAETHSHADVERCIANVIRALQNMSKNNVGALIVLSKGNLPKQVLQSGVELDAEISTQLIEGVFFPKSPLHDGAMVIRGHKIQAAGCFLPLTQKTSYPKDFGTRHRAGIGITEVSNVVALIVSEETGIISIVKQGNVQRYADYDTLKSALRDYYWQELPLGDNKKKDK